MKLQTNYGINEELFEKCVDSIQDGKKTAWVLCDTTAKIQFYQLLHPFLKRWKKTQCSTKSFIGALYLAIDKDFAGKRPINVYRYVDSLLSKGPSSLHHSANKIQIKNRLLMKCLIYLIRFVSCKKNWRFRRSSCV
jgi:hypothetical protein